MKISLTEIERMKQLSRRSILWDYCDEIDAMRDEGISYVLILLWLKKQGIETSVQNIRQFYERNKENHKSPQKQLDSSSKDEGLFDNLL